MTLTTGFSCTHTAGVNAMGQVTSDGGARDKRCGRRHHTFRGNGTPATRATKRIAAQTRLSRVPTPSPVLAHFHS